MSQHRLPASEAFQELSWSVSAVAKELSTFSDSTRDLHSYRHFRNAAARGDFGIREPMHGAKLDNRATGFGQIRDGFGQGGVLLMGSDRIDDIRSIFQERPRCRFVYRKTRKNPLLSNHLQRHIARHSEKIGLGESDFAARFLFVQQMQEGCLPDIIHVSDGGKLLLQMSA